MPATIHEHIRTALAGGPLTMAALVATTGSPRGTISAAITRAADITRVGITDSPEGPRALYGLVDAEEADGPPQAGDWHQDGIYCQRCFPDGTVAARRAERDWDTFTPGLASIVYGVVPPVVPAGLAPDVGRTLADRALVEAGYLAPERAQRWLSLGEWCEGAGTNWLRPADGTDASVVIRQFGWTLTLDGQLVMSGPEATRGEVDAILLDGLGVILEGGIYGTLEPQHPGTDAEEEAREAIEAVQPPTTDPDLEHIRATHVACCPDCGEVTRADEDRCCLTCGRDLIVFADRHSMEVAAESAERFTTQCDEARAELERIRETLARVPIERGDGAPLDLLTGVEILASEVARCHGDDHYGELEKLREAVRVAANERDDAGAMLADVHIAISAAGVGIIGPLPRRIWALNAARIRALRERDEARAELDDIRELRDGRERAHVSQHQANELADMLGAHPSGQALIDSVQEILDRAARLEREHNSAIVQVSRAAGVDPPDNDLQHVLGAVDRLTAERDLARAENNRLRNTRDALEARERRTGRALDDLGVPPGGTPEGRLLAAIVARSQRSQIPGLVRALEITVGEAIGSLPDGLGAVIGQIARKVDMIAAGAVATDIVAESDRDKIARQRDAAEIRVTIFCSGLAVLLAIAEGHVSGDGEMLAGDVTDAIRAIVRAAGLESLSGEEE